MKRSIKRQFRYLSAILILCTPLLSAGQPASGAAQADGLWMRIQGLVEEYHQVRNEAREKARAEKKTRAEEGAKRAVKAPEGGMLPPAKTYQIRELALEFYESYPNDSRSGALRRAFLSLSPTDPFDPFSSAVLRVQREEKLKADGLRDMNARIDSLLKMAADAQVDEGTLSRVFHKLRGFVMQMHLTVDEQRAIHARLQASSNETLRELAAGSQRFLALREQPLDLKLPTPGGGVMDLRQLRGKVVLLDIWSMGCSSCISAIPSMQTLYEKYRDRGFEVVGVFLTIQNSPEKQAEEADRGLRIMRQQGATWTDAVMAGESTVQAFMRQYSLSGVPVLWLLDRTGRLVLDVDLGADFDGPRAGEARIEQEIKRLSGPQGDTAAASAIRWKQRGE